MAEVADDGFGERYQIDWWHAWPVDLGRSSKLRLGPRQPPARRCDPRPDVELSRGIRQCRLTPPSVTERDRA